MTLPKTNGYVRWQSLTVIVALFGIVVAFLLSAINGVSVEARETRGEFLMIQSDLAEIKADVKFLIRQSEHDQTLLN